MSILCVSVYSYNLTKDLRSNILRAVHLRWGAICKLLSAVKRDNNLFIIMGISILASIISFVREHIKVEFFLPRSTLILFIASVSYLLARWLYSVRCPPELNEVLNYRLFIERQISSVSDEIKQISAEQDAVDHFKLNLSKSSIFDLKNRQTTTTLTESEMVEFVSDVISRIEHSIIVNRQNRLKAIIANLKDMEKTYNSLDLSRPMSRWACVCLIGVCGTSSLLQLIRTFRLVFDAAF